MTPLSSEQIETIAQQIVGIMDKKSVGNQIPTTSGISEGNGIFSTIDAAVKAANTAQLQLMKMTLEKRKEIIAAIRKDMLIHADDLAKRAHEETGLGRYEDKIKKNQLVAKKTPGTEDLNPKVYTGDRGLTLIEQAPFGVLGAITPVTNPTSSIICNTIGIVAAGNSVVFNVHPSARNVSIYNIQLLNKAITKVGGPMNLVTAVSTPTQESANELMHHPGIRLLVVTGGGGVVKAAMNSGKRAICAGPGNPPVVVDETADIESAAKNIVMGASLDNNIICVDEKEVFVVESVADQLIEALSRNNAVILTTAQINKLDKVIFAKNNGLGKPANIEKSLIGKDIQVILEKIGLNVSNEKRIAIAPVEKYHPLVWTEQMMPVIPLVRMSDANSAIDIAKKAEHGYGHSAVMYSKNLDNLSRMAKEMNCSIFVKNGPSYSGLGFGGEGYTSFSIASPTGEGLTGPHSFSRERRCVLVDHFRIV